MNFRRRTAMRFPLGRCIHIMRDVIIVTRGLINFFYFSTVLRLRALPHLNRCAPFSTVINKKKPNREVGTKKFSNSIRSITFTTSKKCIIFIVIHSYKGLS